MTDKLHAVIYGPYFIRDGGVVIVGNISDSEGYYHLDEITYGSHAEFLEDKEELARCGYVDLYDEDEEFEDEDVDFEDDGDRCDG